MFTGRDREKTLHSTYTDGSSNHLFPHFPKSKPPQHTHLHSSSVILDKSLQLKNFPCIQERGRQVVMETELKDGVEGRAWVTVPSLPGRQLGGWVPAS